jgi:hypothetical protein
VIPTTSIDETLTAHAAAVYGSTISVPPDCHGANDDGDE